MTAIGLNKAMKQRFLGELLKIKKCSNWSCVCVESPLLARVEERLAGVILLNVHVDGKDIN